MTRLCSITLLSFFLLSGCASAPAVRGAGALPVASSSAHAGEVESFFRSGIEAFNRHDLDAFMQQFASDIEMYTPTGWLRGHSAVRERFESTFAQFPAVRMEIDQLQARSVSADTVITDFRWRVYPMGRGPAFHGVGTGVYVRRDGRWVEVLEHETVVRVDEGLPGR
jgi:uncharacterized protein (TIGR02246 family)